MKIALFPKLFRPQRIGLKGEFTVVHTNAEGKVLNKFTKKNLIVNTGKAEVSDLIGDVNTVAAFNWLAIGTGAVAAAVGDTLLGAEITTNGGERAVATSITQVTTSVTDDTLQLVKQWTFTGSFSVTEAGVFNVITANTIVMLCRQVFSAIAVVSTDKLEVTWKIQVS